MVNSDNNNQELDFGLNQSNQQQIKQEKSHKRIQVFFSSLLINYELINGLNE